ncbi:tumor necrosis factor receptor superfamily member 6B-like [Epinephelus fuscoguttatus]|uniref:tumor necrosis factor receptor superfamily member 6B-like n=1 Tax=Epinephelus fuscoguttatus TaxID=293821 RepID=UPI0020D1B49A|nr:tumor necrosis factor receptor superfamily member 6B-like [Epinephelus fuscoguttatus]
MMLRRLLPVVLLSLPAVLVDGVAEPLLTFTDKDPITGVSVECDRCPPGTYLRARCTTTQKSECSPCPTGSFTELWNYIGKCLRCGVCGQYQVVKTPCTAQSDCQCECKPGYYYKKKWDMCLRHSECPCGQGVLTKGTPDEDTVCHSCPNGTFSNTVSPHQNCTLHKSCNAPGQELVLKGSTWHDSVCTTCEELKSKNGGDYLKEILPDFFVHQKINIKRLRQIVHKLPSEDSKRQGATLRLNLSELNARINTWVASATANQVRQLPGILNKTGANGASKRLQNKLQRINLNLKELCDMRNEVDVIAISG